jgi:hypothetical protein
LGLIKRANDRSKENPISSANYALEQRCHIPGETAWAESGGNGDSGDDGGSNKNPGPEHRPDDDGCGIEQAQLFGGHEVKRNRS